MVLPDLKQWELSASNTSLAAFSLKYPLSAGWKPLGIGGLVAILASMLFIPIIGLWGYRYRIARAGARGDVSAPAFDDVGSIIWNGILFAAVFLPYVIVVGAISVAIAVGTASVGTLIADVGLAVWLAAGTYVGYAIHPTFVATGSIKETYAGGRFLRVAGTRTYLIGFVLAFVLRLVVAIVLLIVTVISVITIVGPIVVYAVWYAYDEFIPGALWGHVAYELADAGVVPAVTAADSLDL